jgi:hypothetical protein
MAARNKTHLFISGVVILTACFFYQRQTAAMLSISTDPPSVSFGAVTKNDLDAGFVEIGDSSFSYAARISITDTSPVNWTLQVKTATPEFMALEGVKQCGDLSWRINGSGPYTPFTAYDSAVTSGSGSGDVDIDLKLRTEWSDTPDNYSLVIVYTISEDI